MNLSMHCRWIVTKWRYFIHVIVSAQTFIFDGHFDVAFIETLYGLILMVHMNTVIILVSFFFFKVVFSSKEICQWFIDNGRQAISFVIESTGKVIIIIFANLLHICCRLLASWVEVFWRRFKILAA